MWKSKSNKNNTAGSPQAGQAAKKARWFLREVDRPLARAMRVGRVSAVVLTLLLLALLGRVMQLQTQPPKQVARLIDSQFSQSDLLYRRGQILDRRGRILASTRLAKRLFVDPQIVEDPCTFAEQVGYRLGYDPAWLEQRISRADHRRYVVIDPLLNDERSGKLAGLNLSGLSSEPRPVRDYPNGDLAGQVIGFVGAEGNGLEGLELIFNQYLNPQPGRIGYLRDARRQPLWVEQGGYVPGHRGVSIQSSLDLTIQTFAQEELEQACTAYGAESGQVIVMDPFTGEILAMASYPSFDPTHFGQSTPQQRRNRTVTDVYEPGSTFKVFMWAAATEAGAARPDERIDCTTSGVYVTPKGRRLHDVHAHGLITWDEVLVKSSNIGMAIVGQRMGEQRLHDAVWAFGFGSKPGSGLPGESPGIVNPLKKWTHYSVTSVPMGQEVAVTGLQLVRGFGAIANGGFLVTPTILFQPESQTALGQRPQIYERILSPAVAAHTRGVLRRVVLEGTGRKANSDQYAIFGKTGTAQVPDRVHGGYLPDTYVSSFVAGAPLESPRVVVACIIHRPDKSKGHYGGTVAAPAAMRIIEKTLAYLGVPASPHDADPAVQLASR